MKKRVLKVHEDDNVVVALTNLSKNDTVSLNSQDFTLQEDISAKHKFAANDFQTGDPSSCMAYWLERPSLPLKKAALFQQPM